MRPSTLCSALLATAMLVGCGDLSERPGGDEQNIDARDLSAIDEKADTAAVEIAASESDVAAAAMPDGARTILCDIKSNGSDGYSGPCLFLPDEGGSFSLSLPGEEPILPNIAQISVWLTGEGQGDVRGLTIDGINSRWGEVTRSTTDAACWQGSDFEICAR